MSVDRQTARYAQARQAILRLGLLAIVSLVMMNWTWKAWANPIVDFGRETYTAWRLSEGDSLYRDVAYFSGPLSPHVNAAVMSIFGKTTDSLFLFNFVLQALITLILYVIVRRISDGNCAFYCALVFQVFFAYAHYELNANHNYIGPYSHELTHGILLSLTSLIVLNKWMLTCRKRWAVAAGLTLGLVFLTKPEPFAATLLACMGATAIAVHRFPERRTLTAFGAALILATACSVVTGAVALLNTYLPLSAAIRDSLSGWQYVFRSDITKLPFYRECAGLFEPLRSLSNLTFWFVAQLLLLRFSWRDATGTPKNAIKRFDLCLVVVFVGILAVHPTSARPMASLSPLPVWLVLILLHSFRNLPRIEQEDQNRLSQGIVLQLLALGMLAKIPLNARIFHYGFALGMPGVITLCVAIWQLHQEVKRRNGSGVRFLAHMAILPAIIGGGHLLNMARNLQQKNSCVFADGTSILRETTEKAASINTLLRVIDKRVGADRTLAVWPQGALINFLSHRRNPTPYVVVMPPEVLMFREEAILASYRETPPDYVVLFDSDLSEYGVKGFGSGYAERLCAWLMANYDQAIPLEQLNPNSRGYRFRLLTLRATLQKPPPKQTGPK